MAARKTSLRVATPEDAQAQPAKKAPKTVTEAVTSGTQREQLVAMRARIAKAIDEPNIRGADLAALSRRLLEIGREIDALDVAAKQAATESAEVDDEAFSAEAL